MSETTNETSDTKFDEWVVLELMGHRREAGRLREVQVAGAGMLRLDIPDGEGGTRFTRYYSPSAIYAMHPVSEEIATAMASRLAEPPVSRYELPKALSASLAPTVNCESCGESFTDDGDVFCRECREDRDVTEEDDDPFPDDEVDR